MRKETKKQTLLALAAGLAVVVTGAAMTRQNVSANEAETESATFAMITGASVRFDSEHYGLRFAAEVPSEPQENETYHMVIFPASYVERYALTSESDFVAALDEKKDEGAKYIDMPCLVYSSEATEGVFESGKYYVRGSVTSIQYSHIDGDFFGIAYKATTQENGDVMREYASYTEGENVRDIVQVSSTLLYNDKYKEGSDEYNVLTKIFNQAVNHSNDVAAENKDDAHAAFDLPTSYSIALDETKQFKPTKLTGVPYDWSSEDDTVATVDQDGNVQAKKIGTTKITYKIAHETVTCDIEVTSDHRFDSMDKLKVIGAKEIQMTIADTDEEKIGLPQGATSKKVVKVTLDNPTGSTRSIHPVIDISSISHDTDNSFSFDYISLKVYTKAPVWFNTGYTGLTNNADGNTDTMQWKKVDVQAVDYTSDYGWIELKIPVSCVKAAYEEGYDYLTLYHWIGSANFDKAWYFHSWEIVHATNVRFDTVGSIMNANWSKAIVDATDESVGIGLPQGVTGNEVLKLSTTETGGGSVFPVFNIVAVTGGLNKISDNAYISLKLYTKSEFYCTNGQIFLANKDNTKIGLGGCSRVWEVGSTSNGWMELKIPVSSIKTAHASGYDFIYMDLWKSNKQDPFYFHSWSLVTPITAD